MTRSLAIEPEAELDLKQAFAWYEQQRPGLGGEFLLAVEAAIAVIQRHTESFPMVRPRIRRATVRRFPYGVFFVVDGQSISVIAVLHAMRDPAVWDRKQKGS